MYFSIEKERLKMGFSTVVSQVVLFMSILMIIVVLSVVYSTYVNSSNQALEDQQNQMRLQLDTSFEIINSSYSANQINVYLKNTGSIKMSIESIDFYLDNERVARNDTNLTKTIVASTNLINPNFWDPEEELLFQYNKTGLAGNHLMRFGVENGVVRTGILQI